MGQSLVCVAQQSPEPGVGVAVAAGVGAGVGTLVGNGVGAGVGNCVGAGVGAFVGSGVGAGVGAGAADDVHSCLLLKLQPVPAVTPSVTSASVHSRNPAALHVASAAAKSIFSVQP